MIREFGADTASFDWTQTAVRTSLLCGVSLLLCLALGVVTHHERQGMNAAYGAMSVAFGSFQRDKRAGHVSRILASFVMAASILVGGLVGGSLAFSVLAVGVWGLWCGMLVSLSTESMWVGIQACVALFLAISYELTGGRQFERAAFVLAGGLLQASAIYMFCKLGWLDDCAPQSDVAALEAELRPHVNLRSAHFRFALRMSAVLAIAEALSRYMGVQNAYWVPMTTLLVLKPDLVASFARGLARIAGTLIGAGLLTLFVAHARPDKWSLAVLTVLFAVLCYNLLRVNYALYTVCITSYVVLMLSFAGMPVQRVVVARVVNTLIGGAVGLAGRAIAARWEVRAA